MNDLPFESIINPYLQIVQSVFTVYKSLNTKIQLENNIKKLFDLDVINLKNSNFKATKYIVSFF